MAKSRATGHIPLPRGLPTAIRDELNHPAVRDSALEALRSPDNILSRLVSGAGMAKIWKDLERLGADDHQIVIFFRGAIEAVSTNFADFRKREQRIRVLRRDLVKTANHLAELLDEARRIGHRPLELESLYCLIQAASKQRGIAPWLTEASFSNFAFSGLRLTDCIRTIAVEAARLEPSYVNGVIAAAMASRKANKMHQALRYFWAHLRDKGGFAKSDALGRMMSTVIAVALGDSAPTAMPDASYMRKLMRPKSPG